MQQSEIIKNLPVHLRAFVQEQDYTAYSPRDHALWRFLMRQLKSQLSDSAHTVYLQGLQAAGISAEYIPKIDEMNQSLARIGWKALGVDGFIPPAIFMEFQSLKVLVIAMNMRTIDQVLYTPAPDILHESAGHAPFLVDVDYAEFLQRFGEIGMKAIASREDEQVYEAIRHLSICKENPDATEAEISEAEQHLVTVNEANQQLSEAALLARLHWWTVEYGLVGDTNDYKIFGAGLLSSLGESRDCLDDRAVNKKVLTPDAINQAYDITCAQPQLFVTHSCRHLSQVLHDVAQGLAQSKGGAEAVQTAIKARTVCTFEYNSGIQVSGIASRQITDAMNNICYLQTTGKTQLAWHGEQLPGHGIDFHRQGFGSPVGFVNEFSRCLSTYSIDELGFAGIEPGKRATLEFVSGIVVSGELQHITRRDQKNILFSFSDCTVTDANNAVLFEPSWGLYDMAVGTTISSVFGGAADPSGYLLFEAPKEKTCIHNDDKPELFTLYQQVRTLRLDSTARSGQQQNEDLQATIVSLSEKILQCFPEEWLLLIELYELCLRLKPDLAPQVLQAIKQIEQPDQNLVNAIDTTIELINNH